MKAATTRDAILDAAVEYASLRGLEELSIGGLASAVDMSKSGLFAHFGSKQELQLATVGEAWGVFEAAVLAEPREDAQYQLHDLLERWLSFYEREVFAGGCFFLISAVELAARGDAVSKALADAMERQLAVLEGAVRGANESGELAPPKDPQRTALLLHALLCHADALFQVRRDPGLFDGTRAIIDELLGSD